MGGKSLIAAIMASATTSAVRVCGQVQQADVTGRAFDEGADLRGLILADDQIALPMAGYGAIVEPPRGAR